MRHRVKKKKFNRDKGHRDALKFMLTKALLENEKLKTTTPKAKFIRPIVEKLVTRAKRGDTLANRKYLLKKLRNNRKLVERLVEEVAPKYKNRSGGYLRIRKLRKRWGDNAEVSVISWVEDEKVKRTKDKELSKEEKTSKNPKSKKSTKDKKTKEAKSSA